jgi:tyrosyl-tRNA synthetase
MNLTVLLADWHSWINNKFGGDMEKIRIAGRYFIHSFKSMGVKGSNVEFKWADDLVKENGYWETLVKVAKRTSLRRVVRSLPITGRKETEEIHEFAWLIYPLMQVTDIYMLDVDIAAAGMDQRKAHMLARDISKSLGRKKPAFVHTPLLPSLDMEVPLSKEERLFSKMSKSKPSTAIFIHDDEDVIKKKINRGYCPPRDSKKNPFMYLYKYIVFPYLRDDNKPIILNTRKGEFEYTQFNDLEKDYQEGLIHPLDLKEAASRHLTEILSPVRKYFDRHTDILDSMNKIMMLG